MQALDADALRQRDDSLKVGRSLRRARHERCHNPCHDGTQTLLEHDEPGRLVDQSVRAKDAVVDFERQAFKRRLIKGSHELNDVRHLRVSRGTAMPGSVCCFHVGVRLSELEAHHCAVSRL